MPILISSSRAATDGENFNRLISKKIIKLIYLVRLIFAVKKDRENCRIQLLVIVIFSIENVHSADR